MAVKSWFGPVCCIWAWMGCHYCWNCKFLILNPNEEKQAICSSIKKRGYQLDKTCSTSSSCKKTYYNPKVEAVFCKEVK